MNARITNTAPADMPAATQVPHHSPNGPVVRGNGFGACGGSTASAEAVASYDRAVR